MKLDSPIVCSLGDLLSSFLFCLLYLSIFCIVSFFGFSIKSDSCFALYKHSCKYSMLGTTITSSSFNSKGFDIPFILHIISAYLSSPYNANDTKSGLPT